MKDIHLSFVGGAEAPPTVLELVRDAYQRTYGTSPGVAKTYVIAWRHGKPVGCMGIEEADENGQFPIERIYGIERSKLPAPIDSSNTVQFGRLVVQERDLTPLVLYAASWYGLRNGKTYCLIEHNRAVHRVVARFGIRFMDIECGPAILAQVPAEDRSYYAKQEMRPYVADLREALKALESRISRDMVHTFSVP